jgi:tRNA (cytosine40_48-C5)-methyltransferase
MDFLERYAKWGFAQNPSQSKLPLCIRINTLKGNVSEILASFDSSIVLRKISDLEYGYIVESENSLVSSKQYLLGQIYIQEAASQYAAQILAPTEFDVVLDMCAAPGSKTTHIAQLMQNKGRIVACDSRKDRCAKLSYNLERTGVTNTQVYFMDARELKPKVEKFDKILLDAPCSGNFMIDSQWFEKRTLSGVMQMAAQQKDLLEAAYKLLKDGGLLLYTTCSLEIEENEEVIEYLLSQVENMEIVPISVANGKEGLTSMTQSCVRLWPSISGTQGFFFCLLRKTIL